MSNESDKEFHAALFAHLVMSLAQSAMMALGKVVNPATNRAEVNLEAAQQTIDLLDMLQAKTRGNLDQDEDRMLKGAISMLKLNYVETAQASPTPPPAATETSPPVAESPTPEKKDDDGKVKFRKTYG